MEAKPDKKKELEVFLERWRLRQAFINEWRRYVVTANGYDKGSYVVTGERDIRIIMDRAIESLKNKK